MLVRLGYNYNNAEKITYMLTKLSEIFTQKWHDRRADESGFQYGDQRG